MEWYTLQVASNREKRICEALNRKVKVEGYEDRVGRILAPTVREKRVRQGKTKIIDKRLYPGYIFIEMACGHGVIDEDIWFMLKDTNGVGNFIGANRIPTAIPIEQMQHILDHYENPREPSIAGTAEVGDTVSIIDGSFEGFVGTVDVIDEKRGVITVDLTVFGRSTPVDVEYWQIRKEIPGKEEEDSQMKERQAM